MTSNGNPSLAAKPQRGSCPAFQNLRQGRELLAAVPDILLEEARPLPSLVGAVVGGALLALEVAQGHLLVGARAEVAMECFFEPLELAQQTPAAELNVASDSDPGQALAAARAFWRIPPSPLMRA